MQFAAGEPCPQCRRKLPRDAIGPFGYHWLAWLVLLVGLLATIGVAAVMISCGVRSHGRRRSYGLGLPALIPLFLAGGLMNRIPQTRTIRCACGFTTQERSR
jgi:hypothetical protein